MKKKKLVLIITIICFVAVVGLSVFLFRNKAEDKVVLNFKNTLGVWVWNKEGANYLDFAIENGVDEIYYHASEFGDDDKNFIKKAKKNDIKVYLLCGDKDWAENDDWQAKINKFLEFNQTYPNQAFEGIHFDVEPHQFDDFHEKEEYYLTNYVEFIDKVTTEYPEIKFDVDIPFWWDNVLTYKSEQKEAYKFIIDYADRVFVMSYRDTAEGVFNVAKDELAYAKEKDKKIFLSVETGNAEDIVSFKDESKAYMNEQIEMLDEMINQYYGLSIHHIKTWFNLKEE